MLLLFLGISAEPVRRLVMLGTGWSPFQVIMRLNASGVTMGMP